MNTAWVGDDLVLANYVNLDICNLRVLKRVPNDSRVPLEENLSHKINDVFYNVEKIIYWLVLLTPFLFFLEQRRRSGC